jgi:HAD superfamily hydrolase (TIGR01509 family)
MALVTIDFHNTLFRCDEWFRLEIERLPEAVIREVATLIPPDRDPAALIREGHAVYRSIREEAMRSGVECDAVASIQRVFAQLRLNVDDPIIDSAVETVMYRATAKARPRRGAEELVHTLFEQGLELAVVSSAAYHPFLEWCLEHHNLKSSFRHVVTSASCGIYKSDPEIYRHTLNLFSAPASRSVHIGDSHRFDVRSASRVGMRTILLTDSPYDEFDPAPDAIITTLGEAQPHLDRLLSNV